MQSRPRIAYISSYFPHRAEPQRGHSAYHTLRRLIDWADIKAFVPLATYLNIPWLLPRTFQYRAAANFEPPPDLAAEYLTYPALPVVGRLWNGWLCRWRMQDAVASFAPDVILNYWLYPDGWAAAEIGHRLGVPVVLGTIGSDVRQIRDRVTRYWTRQALCRARAVLAVSDDLRCGAVALGAPAEASFTVLNGCDTDMFYWRDRAAARAALGIALASELVVYVGYLIATKGLQELWTAFTGLAAARPGLEIVLIGEGALRKPLEAAARSAGLAARFRFLGRKSSEEVAQWMAAATAFCLPSYSEGCPNVVVEALASGRPVLGTKVGGIPELVRQGVNGWLIAPRDSAALSEGLRVVLERDWDEQAIARAGRRSWDDSARETRAVVERVLEGW